MLMAGLESRKNTLAARRAALDEVFEQALGGWLLWRASVSTR
jgi:hypothetical protein